MNVKVLLIKSCNANVKWYSNLIGHIVPFLLEGSTEYRTLQPEGYINYVSIEDADIISIDNTKINLYDRYI